MRGQPANGTSTRWHQSILRGTRVPPVNDGYMTGRRRRGVNTEQRGLSQQHAEDGRELGTQAAKQSETVRERPTTPASTITPIRRPLQQDLESQKDVPQRAGPRFLLAELLLHRRVANLVLHDPVQGTMCQFTRS